MPGQSFSVFSNYSSLQAQKDLYTVNMGLNKTLGRLSSGQRNVEARDDAAGLSIASGLTTDGYALDQAVRNANDGVAIIQIADGALNKIDNLLQRAVTLAEQSASDTVGTNEKAILNIEFRELMEEIDRVVSVANFKGEQLFDSSNAFTKSIYIGDTQISSFITLSIGGANGMGTGALGLSNSSVASQSDALNTLSDLNNSIASVARFRGALGAQQNLLTNAVGVIQVQALNIKNAASAISDANMAEEIVNLSKWQILMQSGMSSLAQANASARMLIQLFG